MTARRTMGAERFAAPMVVGDAAHADAIEAQLATPASSAGTHHPRARRAQHRAGDRARRARACRRARRDDAGMPSDHVIGDVAAFHAAIEKAAPLVEAGWLATFGIAPTQPETGYGYICRGDPIAPPASSGARFVEKPTSRKRRELSGAGRPQLERRHLPVTAGTLPRRARTPLRRRWRRRRRGGRGRRGSDGAHSIPIADAFGR